MIASYGQGWEESIVQVLGESRGRVLRQRVLSQSGGDSEAAAVNVEQRIIGASLTSLRGPQATACQKLFKLLVVFQEDFIIPISVVEALWEMAMGRDAAATVRTSNSKEPENDSTRATRSLLVRERINMLLHRSLLLGSLHSGLK